MESATRKAFIIKPGYPIAIADRDDANKTDVQRNECIALAKLLVQTCMFKEICIIAEDDAKLAHNIAFTSHESIEQCVNEHDMLFVACSALDEQSELGQLDKSIICDWRGKIVWCYWDLRLKPQFANWQLQCAGIIVLANCSPEKTAACKQFANLPASVKLFSTPWHVLPMLYDSKKGAAMLRTSDEFTVAFPIVRFNDYDVSRQKAIERLVNSGMQVAICGDMPKQFQKFDNVSYYGTIKTSKIIDWYEYFDGGVVLQDKSTAELGSIMFRNTEISCANKPVFSIKDTVATPFKYSAFANATNLQQAIKDWQQLTEYEQTTLLAYQQTELEVAFMVAVGQLQVICK